MQAKNQKIVVLGTGGTIAGKSSSSDEGLSYRAAQLSIDELLKAIVGTNQSLPQSLENIELIAEQVSQLDSKDMDFVTWRLLAQRCEHWMSQTDVKAVVVTHGTDTLEETAYFLSRVIGFQKPIVLTCAMRPANFQHADGPQNLRDALNVAAKFRGRGVWLVAAGEIHHSQFVQKIHPTRINAFDSGESGVAATVINDVIQMSSDFKEPEAHSPSPLDALPDPENWPWVEIIMNHVQASSRLVSVMVTAGVQGIVVAGTGNGAVSSSLLKGLQQAHKQGIQIRLATRCNQGPVLPTDGHAFKADSGLSPVKTRVALMLDMMSKQQSH